MSTKTLRRRYIDSVLSEASYTGAVLDMGGQKENKRGAFRPPLDQVVSWRYVNTDASTNPDYLCSAEKTPLDDTSVDTVVFSEVLEHLEKPGVVLQEIGRVLKPGGTLIATVPFMQGVHADPFDFQRWTSEKITTELENVGLEVKEMYALGGLGATIHDLIYQSVSGSGEGSRSLFPKITRRIILPFFSLFISKNFKNEPSRTGVTTGYYFTAVKK